MPRKKSTETLLHTFGRQVPDTDNLYDCELKFKFEDEITNASALKFPNFTEAHREYKRLCGLTSMCLPKTYGLEKYQNGEWLVLVERIRPFHAWFNAMNCTTMWKFAYKKCVGVGAAFKDKFNQIILGLEAIHLSKSYHGNLLKGVFLRSDDTICLCNFSPPGAYDDNNSLKKDLKQFKELVNLVASSHPPPGIEDIGTVAEVKHFNKLFDTLLSDGAGVLGKNEVYWLYRAPILWGPLKKTSFFTRLSRALHINPKCAIEYLSVYIPHFFKDEWWMKISPSTPLLETYNHKTVVCADCNDPNESYEKCLGLNSWYTLSIGIVVLIRNFLHHCPAYLDPFNHIEYDFPEALGVVYNELAFGSYMGKILFEKDVNNSEFVHRTKVSDYLFRDSWIFAVEEEGPKFC